MDSELALTTACATDNNPNTPPDVFFTFVSLCIRVSEWVREIDTESVCVKHIQEVPKMWGGNLPVSSSFYCIIHLLTYSLALVGGCCMKQYLHRDGVSALALLTTPPKISPLPPICRSCIHRSLCPFFFKHLIVELDRVEMRKKRNAIRRWRCVWGGMETGGRERRLQIKRTAHTLLCVHTKSQVNILPAWIHKFERANFKTLTRVFKNIRGGALSWTTFLSTN